MRIQHNISAMNSYRQMGGNNNALSKNLEKLSSGFRINRAGDDAAGLAISEKMRSQIKGLETAQKNANDGISLIQTAEGALTEVHSMLNRMTELATQSANGTYEDKVDRENLQAEVDALLDEIDRISKSTNFNGINLLDGSLAAEKTVATQPEAEVMESVGKQVMASANGTNIEVAPTAATKSTWTSGTFGTTVAATGTATVTVSYKDADGVDHELELEDIAVTTGNDAATIASALNSNEEFSALFEASKDVSGNLVVQSKESGAGAAEVADVVVTGDATVGNAFGTTASQGTTVSGNDASCKVNLVSGGSGTTPANPTAGDTVTVGDKTFEFVDAAGDEVKTEGAIAVVIGAAANNTAENLAAAMKANGIKSAEADATNTYQVNIKDVSEIEVAQKGAQITEADEAFAVVGNEETKASATATMQNGAAANEYKFTVEYVDQSGQLQKSEITYVGDTDADKNAKNILAELQKDEKLAATFDMAYDSATDKLSLTAKDAGTDGGRVVSMTAEDASAVNGNPTIVAAKDSSKTLELKDATLLKAGDTVTINGKTYEFVTGDNSAVKGEGNTAVTLDATAANTMKNLANALRQDGLDVTVDAAGKITFEDNAELPVKEEVTEPSKGLKLQIGDTADEFNQITVTVDDMSAKGLGIEGLNIGDPDSAAASIDKIKNAINKVSSTRGDLGAIQNRLEHTINNLGVTTENITAAESRIRDTDMASEMMAYTKNNILIQASQAMLAQANQVPQGVLQLLQ